MEISSLITKQAHRFALSALSLFFVCLAAACAGPAATPTDTAPAAPAPTDTQAPPPTDTAPAQESTPAGTAEATQPFTYTVLGGDTVSGIAARFGLQPETVLWANYAQLFDNPDMLLPGMELLILPVDGVYHQVGGGDTVNNLAAFFGAQADAIIAWPGNDIDPDNSVVELGQWVLIPGGQRASQRRPMPNLPRSAAAVTASEYGSGACRDDFGAGPVGDGVYAWPVQEHEVRGEGYWAEHPAVDLAAEPGEWVRAADDGVVVFAGWSNLGYGYLVMLDHGDGDFSLYAGLQQVLAVCGQAVAEGDVIAEAGLTGHPVGAFVHFEIRRGEDFLDPLALLGD